MRPDLVEVTPPLFDSHLRLDSIPEPLQAQALVSKFPIERFVGPILPRLSGVNERRFDLCLLQPAQDREAAPS